MKQTKENLLKKFFEFDADGTFFVKRNFHVEYQHGESVDCVQGNRIYTNQDRETWWDWDEVKIEDFTVYELKKVEW